MSEHFNKGACWGVVDEVTYRNARTEGRKSYARIVLLCKSDEYGPVKVHGKLFDGRDKQGMPTEDIKTLKAILDRDPKTPIKMEGYFNQYKKKGVVYSGFNFYRIELVVQEGPTHKMVQHRASFILTGTVKEKVFRSAEPGHEVIRIEVGRNTFDVLADLDLAKNIFVGGVVQINGSFIDRDAEFSGSGFSRPVVKKIYIREAF